MRRGASLALFARAVAILLAFAGAARAQNPCMPAAGLLVSSVGDPDGIGGTGRGDEDGIGGTGRGDEDGIGGTGIYGTITGFGSLCVNGQHIQYDAGASVRINDQPATSEDLEIGQIAWIEAFHDRDRLRARTISIYSTLIGPITSIDAGTRLIEVLETLVEIPSGALVFDEKGESIHDLSELERGDVVDVSGIRRPDGRVVASRIELSVLRDVEVFEGPRVEDLLRASELRHVSIEGFVQDRTDIGFRIGGVQVDARAVPGLTSVRPDERVWVEGERGPNATLRVDRIQVLPPVIEGRPLSIEPPGDAGADGAAPLLEPGDGEPVPVDGEPTIIDVEPVPIEVEPGVIDMDPVVDLVPDIIVPDTVPDLPDILVPDLPDIVPDIFVPDLPDIVPDIFVPDIVEPPVEIFEPPVDLLDDFQPDVDLLP